MAQSLLEIAKRSIDVGRSSHIVGAGIGARQAGKLGAEPRLTLLVDVATPVEELAPAVRKAVGRGKVPEFDVIEAGVIRALPRTI